MTVIERTIRAAMEAGCDEAERLGYGSELGYAEAASISEKAANVVAEQLQGAVGALEAIRPILTGVVTGTLGTGALEAVLERVETALAHPSSDLPNTTEETA